MLVEVGNWIVWRAWEVSEPGGTPFVGVGAVVGEGSCAETGEPCWLVDTHEVKGLLIAKRDVLGVVPGVGVTALAVRLPAPRDVALVGRSGGPRSGEQRRGRGKHRRGGLVYGKQRLATASGPS